MSEPLRRDATAPPRNVAVLLFDEVEVLDFAGPFEVFSVAGRRDGLDPFRVYTVAETARPVLARNELSVNPRYTIQNCPPPAIVVVPGEGKLLSLRPRLQSKQPLAGPDQAGPRIAPARDRDAQGRASAKQPCAGARQPAA